MKNKENNRTSPLLFLLCFLTCLVTGVFVTQPKSGPSPMKVVSLSEVMPEAGAIVQEEAVAETEAAEAEAVSASAEEIAEGETENTTETAAAGESAEQAVEETAVPEAVYTASPEAGTGYWSKGIGEWYYVIDGHNYHGWLYDTDQRVYYLNPENGVMATGLTEIDGKTYCFSPDGVLQKGRVTIEGNVYELGEDGVLQEGAQPIPEASPQPVITAVPAKPEKVQGA